MQPKHFSEVHTEAKVLEAQRRRGSEESCTKEKEKEHVVLEETVHKANPLV
jgi:hypothetical protein